MNFMHALVLLRQNKEKEMHSHSCICWKLGQVIHISVSKPPINQDNYQIFKQMDLWLTSQVKDPIITLLVSKIYLQWTQRPLMRATWWLSFFRGNFRSESFAQLSILILTPCVTVVLPFLMHRLPIFIFLVSLNFHSF